MKNGVCGVDSTFVIQNIKSKNDDRITYNKLSTLGKFSNSVVVVVEIKIKLKSERGQRNKIGGRCNSFER